MQSAEHILELSEAARRRLESGPWTKLDSLADVRPPISRKQAPWNTLSAKASSGARLGVLPMQGGPRLRPTLQGRQTQPRPPELTRAAALGKNCTTREVPRRVAMAGPAVADVAISPEQLRNRLPFLRILYTQEALLASQRSQQPPRSAENTTRDTLSLYQNSTVLLAKPLLLDCPISDDCYHHAVGMKRKTVAHNMKDAPNVGYLEIRSCKDGSAEEDNAYCIPGPCTTPREDISYPIKVLDYQRLPAVDIKPGPGNSEVQRKARPVPGTIYVSKRADMLKKMEPGTKSASVCVRGSGELSSVIPSTRIVEITRTAMDRNPSGCDGADVASEGIILGDEDKGLIRDQSSTNHHPLLSKVLRDELRTRLLDSLPLQQLDTHHSPCPSDQCQPKPGLPVSDSYSHQDNGTDLSDMIQGAIETVVMEQLLSRLRSRAEAWPLVLNTEPVTRVPTPCSTTSLISQSVGHMHGTPPCVRTPASPPLSSPDSAGILCHTDVEDSCPASLSSQDTFTLVATPRCSPTLENADLVTEGPLPRGLPQECSLLSRNTTPFSPPSGEENSDPTLFRNKVGDVPASTKTATPDLVPSPSLLPEENLVGPTPMLVVQHISGIEYHSGEPTSLPSSSISIPDFVHLLTRAFRPWVETKGAYGASLLSSGEAVVSPGQIRGTAEGVPTEVELRHSSSSGDKVSTFDYTSTEQDTSKLELDLDPESLASDLQVGSSASDLRIISVGEIQGVGEVTRCTSPSLSAGERVGGLGEDPAARLLLDSFSEGTWNDFSVRAPGLARKVLRVRGQRVD